MTFYVIMTSMSGDQYPLLISYLLLASKIGSMLPCSLLISYLFSTLECYCYSSKLVSLGTYYIHILGVTMLPDKHLAEKGGKAKHQSIIVLFKIIITVILLFFMFLLL